MAEKVEYKPALKRRVKERMEIREELIETLRPQTRDDWVNFRIKNKAYPYMSKSGKVFLRRVDKAGTNEGLYKLIVKELGKEYKPSIKEWPEEERPREMLMKYGAENLLPSKLLAIIIRTGNSAKRLSAEELARTITFRNLDSASFSEFCSIDGIGMAKAAQIKAALEIGKRMQRERIEKGRSIKSDIDVFDYYKVHLRDLKKEIFKVVLLNSKPTPTDEDKEITKRLLKTFNVLGVKVLDHIIIGENTHFSFVRNRLMQK